MDFHLFPHKTQFHALLQIEMSKCLLTQHDRELKWMFTWQQQAPLEVALTFKFLFSSDEVAQFFKWWLLSAGVS